METLPPLPIFPRVVLAVLVLASPVRASVEELQASAAAHPNLLHQFTFDGADDIERRQDKAGNGGDLVENFTEGTTAADLTYGAVGWDDTSDAVGTFRENPGPDISPNGRSAAFRIPSTTIPMTFSFEIIFQTFEAELSGGYFNLAYLLANRSADGSGRGYFLMQGSSEQPFGSDGSDLASLIGNSFSPTNEVTLAETVEPNHWYYVAGSYSTDGASTTFTNYIADLTAGETTLGVLGPTTVSGGYSTETGPFGVGTRYDGTGETLNGLIDEVNLYGAELSQAQFQENLNLLTGGPAPFIITEFVYDPDADTATITWNSTLRVNYAIEESEDLVSWNEVADAVGEAGKTTHIEMNVPENRQIYYRIKNLDEAEE